MSDNTIMVVGNLTKDPELRFTAGGKAVISFTVAVAHRYVVNGEWQEKASFFYVSAWGLLAENAAATFIKGMRIIVVGRLEQEEYVDRDGEKRTVIKIVADDLGPSLKWAFATVERVPSHGAQQVPVADFDVEAPF